MTLGLFRRAFFYVTNLKKGVPRFGGSVFKKHLMVNLLWMSRKQMIQRVVLIFSILEMLILASFKHLLHQVSRTLNGEQGLQLSDASIRCK